MPAITCDTISPRLLYCSVAAAAGGECHPFVVLPWVHSRLQPNPVLLLLRTPCILEIARPDVRSLSNVQLCISCRRCPLELPRFGPVYLAGPLSGAECLNVMIPGGSTVNTRPWVLLLRLVREAPLCRRGLETVRSRAAFYRRGPYVSSTAGPPPFTRDFSPTVETRQTNIIDPFNCRYRRMPEL